MRAIKALIFIYLCVTLPFTASANQVSDKIKGGLIQAHFPGCMYAIKKQLQQYGRLHQFPEYKRSSYCQCLSEKYYGNLTKTEHRYMTNNNTLPPRVTRDRGLYQDQCSRLTLE